MLPRERAIAQRKIEESDIVPMSKNHVHSKFIEEVLGHEILYSKGFQELNALWEGRRDDVKRCNKKLYRGADKSDEGPWMGLRKGSCSS